MIHVKDSLPQTLNVWPINIAVPKCIISTLSTFPSVSTFATCLPTFSNLGWFTYRLRWGLCILFIPIPSMYGICTYIRLIFYGKCREIYQATMDGIRDLVESLLKILTSCISCIWMPSETTFQHTKNKWEINKYRTRPYIWAIYYQ